MVNKGRRCGKYDKNPYIFYIKELLTRTWSTTKEPPIKE